MTDPTTLARDILASNPDWRDDANCRSMARVWGHATVDEQRRVCANPMPGQEALL